MLVCNKARPLSDASRAAKEPELPTPRNAIQWQGMYVHNSTVIIVSTGISSHLGLEAFRIPGEQTRSSNVIQFQE